jgi:hypothetical protein
MNRRLTSLRSALAVTVCLFFFLAGSQGESARAQCPDGDGDWICDADDNCPSVFNPSQIDFDGDGIGDACDACTDTDGDGFGDPGHQENTCPEDNCPSLHNPDQIGCDHHGDPVGDGATDVLDVLTCLDVVFAGTMETIDPDCVHSPGGRTDVNCDGGTNVQDVVSFIDVVFRGAVSVFCDPCACDCYPHGCGDLAPSGNLLPNGSLERHCVATRSGWFIYDEWPQTEYLWEDAPADGGQWSLHLPPEWMGENVAYAIVANPIPGGIYRLSVHLRTLPGATANDKAALAMHTATSEKWMQIPPDYEWSEVTLVDTLPPNPGDILRIELWPYFEQLYWTFEGVLFDDVRLELLSE